MLDPRIRSTALHLIRCDLPIEAAAYFAADLVAVLDYLEREGEPGAEHLRRFTKACQNRM